MATVTTPHRGSRHRTGRFRDRLTAGLSALSLIAAALAGAGAVTLSVAGAGPAAAVDRLAVQVTGKFQDTSDETARASRSGYVVGAVATSRLGFVQAPTGVTVAQGQAFQFNVVCATAAGGGCVDGTTLTWDFGDGVKARTTIGVANPDDVTLKPDGTPAASPLVEYHAYVSPGAYTVRVTVDDKSTPAYGAGAIRALVGPRFADVDAAYTATTTAGAPLPGKMVNPVSESVWAVAALGLMPACKSAYTANSSTAVPGERAEDPGRALFCPEPGQDPVTASAGAQTSAPTNPAPRSQFTTDGWASSGANYTDDASCLASAANCGLPVRAFADNGAPKGSPLAACVGKCLTVLTNRKILTSGASPQLWYDPTNCADNVTAMYNPAVTATVTLSRGVEAGCESRGDFLRALLAGVDSAGQDALVTSTGSGALDAVTCPSGTPAPDKDGRDGIRRATALLSGSGVTISPCDPDASLTKGEAYRMLAAAMQPTGTSSVTLADLSDRSLGYGTTAEPYPFAATVYALLGAGAPLVGSSACPVTPRDGSEAACFNPYEPVTRADAAQLLAYFVLGDTSDVAAVQVALTSDSSQVNLGDTAQVRLTIQVPTWLLPFQANWTFALGGTVPGKTATFACATTGSRSMTDTSMSVTCPVLINQQPAGGLLPIVATVNGKSYPPVNLQVNNTAPQVTTVTLPSGVTEDGPERAGTVTFTDRENNPIKAVQVASSATGPWSDLVELPTVVARIPDVDNSSSAATLAVVGQPDANGSYTVYVRACDIGDACSTAKSASGTVTAVNDAPVAYPISNVLRSDNVTAPSGDCTAKQSDPLGPNLLRLRGADPADAGRAGYATAVLTGYTVTAPAGTSAGTMYVCGAGGAWTPVPASGSATSTYPVVLWNPTVGQYATSTFGYTVTDGGYPAGGLTSSSQPITTTNTKPGVAPTALLTVDVTSAAASTGDFTFSGAASHDGGSTAGIVSYAFDYGDGSRTSAQTSPTVTHRYTSAGSYTATLTVTDGEGLTGSTTVTVTALENLIGNPTFESGAGQWNPSGASGVAVATTVTAPHGGAKAGSVSKSTTALTCQVAHMPPRLVKNVRSGYQYQTTAWVRPTSASAGSSFTLNVTETTGSSTVGGLSTTVTLGAAGTWQQVPVTYLAAADGSSLQVTVGLTNFSGTACFDLDDVAMTGAPQPAPTAVTLAVAPRTPTTSNTLTVGGGAGASSWKVERSTAAAMTSPTVVCTAIAGCVDAGLTSGVTYYYRATATNSTASVTSPVVSFVAGLPVPVKPTVTGTVAAQNVTWVTTAGETYQVTQASAAAGPYTATTCTTPGTPACTFAGTGTAGFFFKVTSTNTAGAVTGAAGQLP